MACSRIFWPPRRPTIVDQSCTCRVSRWQRRRLLYLILADDQICGNQTEEPLRYEAITGLTDGQLTELTARVTQTVDGMASAGRPGAARTRSVCSARSRWSWR